MRQKIYFCAAVLCLALTISGAAQKSAPLRRLTVVTEPNAVVWINDVNYGKTDESGRLTLKTFPAGTHRLRVRAGGFKEMTQNLLPTQTGEVRVELVKTTDAAELAFQEAEQLAASNREKAIAAYRRAIKLRPNYPEAQLALARALLDSGETQEALKAVQAARRARPVYPEATAVEGRIHKTDDNEDKSVAVFKRAVTEGKGFQPEALTGLGLLYKERAERSRSEGDFEGEKANYLLAAAELKKAVTQLAGAPDATIVYQLLGDTYERAEKYREAIRVYEDFLRDFPESNEAEAMRSFIVQINKKLKGEQ
jgi:tetratricopeptide (TPR) repeat protein